MSYWAYRTNRNIGLIRLIGLISRTKGISEAGDCPVLVTVTRRTVFGSRPDLRAASAMRFLTAARLSAIKDMDRCGVERLQD